MIKQSLDNLCEIDAGLKITLEDDSLFLFYQVAVEKGLPFKFEKKDLANLILKISNLNSIQIPYELNLNSKCLMKYKRIIAAKMYRNLILSGSLTEDFYQEGLNYFLINS